MGEGLTGDTSATFGKARGLLKLARQEWREATRTRPEDRAKLRQAAEKGWLAISTVADAAARCLPKGQQGTGPEGTPARTGEAIRILRATGGKKAEQKTAAVHGTLHLACFYSDASTCTPDAVAAQFKEVGEVIRLVQNGCNLRAAKRRRAER